MEQFQPPITIGIVTYLGRYESHFKKNIEQLVSFFPDTEIIVVLNGHKDLDKQMAYLKLATSYLAQFPNVRYLTYEKHQALAKGWNLIVSFAQTNGVLLLNDDVLIGAGFKEDLYHGIQKHKDFFLINKSWSHYYITKSLVKKVGRFEERLTGIGLEDGDYILRMAEKNIPICTISTKKIINYVAAPTDAGFEVSDGFFAGKYAKENEIFFRQKWYHSDLDGKGPAYDIVVDNDIYTMQAKRKMEDICPYDYAILDQYTTRFTQRNNTFISHRSNFLFHKLHHYSGLIRNILSSFYKKLYVHK